MPCFPKVLFMKDVFENLEVVVLSFKEAEEGAHFVKTAEEAFNILRARTLILPVVCSGNIAGKTVARTIPF